jgi:UDP-2,3-diacylglucosamine pyrophosphatase LpxH
MFWKNNNLLMPNLDDVLNQAHTLKLHPRDRVVILSDVHLGNGGKMDDFRTNADLFEEILKSFYFPLDYKLILNGDIEELHKFRLSDIEKSWPQIFELFEQFSLDNRLLKIIGNHDYNLINHEDYRFRHHLFPALKLKFQDNILAIFHGHQASHFLEKYNGLAHYLLRYIFKPLRIKNISTAYDSQKQYKVERRIYEFSNKRKIVSIIGHTHRPLFQSFSKVDSLKLQINEQFKKYSKADKSKKKKIEKKIKNLKTELEHCFKKRRWKNLRSSLYNEAITIPSLFNSGCAIGKRGITAVEIVNAKIYLVHWFDAKKSQKYFKKKKHQLEKINGTSFYRTILKKEYLDTVFTRIRLLT